MIENGRNWAGNYTYSATRLHRPKSREQLEELVGTCRKLKALGTRHSFNGIADTAEDLVSLEHFDQIELAEDFQTVTVGAGVRYGTLCQYLHRRGYALHNLASLPHISVAGACATATHGSGDKNSNLATAVTALEMVTANGETVFLSREKEEDIFPGAVVGLGALGIVTKLTLAIEPAYEIRQVVYENLAHAQLEENFDDILASAYSISLFTDWRSDTGNPVWQVWKKQRVPDASFDMPSMWFGATLARNLRHPLAPLSAENCTEQRGIPGPWYERLPHFRLEFTPSTGDELQSEYLVPRANALAALREVSSLRDVVVPVLHLSEVRTVAADDLWMSPCYRQDCVGVHFTWKKDKEGVANVLPLLEERLVPLGARAHWGKLFTLSRELLVSLYPRLPDFQALAEHYDPQGKFRNDFLDSHVL